jgi:GT2 family glycosyltransferase
MDTVQAVVVTFNRKALLVEAIEALLNQTYPLTGIFIIDNASSDGTEACLEARGLLNHPTVKYVKLSENLGGAGGFHHGVALAMAEKPDWVWIMDDDAEPAVDALEKLSAHFNDLSIACVAPIVVDCDGVVDTYSAHRAFMKPRSDASLTSFTRPLGAIDLTSAETIDIDHCSFVGPCIRRSAIGQVGLPEKRFFIHFDDTYYSMLLAKIGRIVLVAEATIHHKEAGKVGIASGEVFGKRYDIVPFSSLWLRYFGYRNAIWLATRGLIPVPIGRILMRHVVLLAGTMKYDDHKLARLWFWNQALFDGFLGRFNNRKPKQLTARP